MRTWDEIVSITESRRRIRAVMDDVDATLSGARASVPQRPQPTHIGEVIVVTSRDVPPDRGDAAPQAGQSLLRRRALTRQSTRRIRSPGANSWTSWNS